MIDDVVNGYVSCRELSQKLGEWRNKRTRLAGASIEVLNVCGEYNRRFGWYSDLTNKNRADLIGGMIYYLFHPVDTYRDRRDANDVGLCEMRPI